MAANDYLDDVQKAKQLVKLSPSYRGILYEDQGMAVFRTTITYYLWDNTEVAGQAAHDLVESRVNWFRLPDSKYYQVDGNMSGLSDPKNFIYSSNGLSVLEFAVSYLSGVTSINWVQETDPNNPADIVYIGADLEWSPRASNYPGDVVGVGHAMWADTSNANVNDNYLIFLDDKAYTSSPEVDGSSRFWLYAHETLHALGLRDISDPSIVSFAGDTDEYNTMKYTVMSYHGHKSFGRSSDPVAQTPTKVFPTSLMLFDYLALQELGILGSYSPSYQDQLNAGMEIIGAGDGYDTDTADDNNVYRWDKDTRVLHTIFDTRGEDTISAAGHDHRAIIDLRQGHFSSYGQKNGSGFSTLPPVENLAIAYGTIIENAVGSNENDVLIGNVYDNNLKGGDGDDFIYGDGFDYDVNEWGLSSSDHESAYASTVGTGYHESSHLQNESGNDTLEGGAGEDTLFGGDGQDILKGDDDEDHLYGGKGQDQLEGGAGNDHYYFNYGDGRDIIVDTEVDNGSNTLHLKHQLADTDYSTIGQLQQIAPDSNIYQEVDTNGDVVNADTIYVLRNTDDADPDNNELLIVIDNGNGGVITIEDFDKDTNVFGLTFSDADDITEPEQNGTTYAVGDGSIASLGETINPNFLNRAAGTQAFINDQEIQFDAALAAQLWTYDGDLQGSYVNGYEFDGGNQNDRLIGGQWRDWLNGYDGDDYIEVGGGQSFTTDPDLSGNFIAGGLGNDFLVGGDDTDFISANHYDKWEADGTTQNANYQAESIGTIDTINGGAGDDALSGGEGNDVIKGGIGDDDIYGDIGDDHLIGGDGLDLMFGDSRFELKFFNGSYIADWNYVESTQGSYTYDDVMDGGQGDDVLLGELGDDTLNGEAGGEILTCCRQRTIYSQVATVNTLLAA